LPYLNGKAVGSNHKYEVNPKAGSGAIDLSSGGRLISPGLYKVDNETLRLSIPFEVRGSRPADFEPADGLMTYTFRQVKTKD
jgi:hypothetical protein